MQKDIVIIGAGIAGLTTALCLAKKNISVTIYEKCKNLEEIGAGIQLSSNATHILKKLNILDEILKYAVQPENINLIDGYNLETLTKLPIKKYTEHYNLTEYLTIHRADLQKVLLNAVNNSKLINLQLGITQLNRTDSPIQIASNGIWSEFRTDKAIHSGYIAWRATIDKKYLNVSNDIQAYLGAKNHIIIYPINSGSAYNIVAITPHKYLKKTWNNIENINLLTQAFKRWNPQILKMLDKARNYSVWSVYTMPSIKFYENNMIFIGDASHGFLPFAAQGASMAIEDAAELSATLATNNINTAIDIYKNKRLNRLKNVKKRGDFNAMAYHATGIIRITRNIILKNSSPMSLLNKLNWLYKYKI